MEKLLWEIDDWIKQAWNRHQRRIVCWIVGFVGVVIGSCVIGTPRPSPVFLIPTPSNLPLILPFVVIPIPASTPTTTPILTPTPLCLTTPDLGWWLCPDSFDGAACVGSTQTNRFHQLDCPYVEAILPEFRICFASCEGAILRSRKPCNHCKPGNPSNPLNPPNP